MKTQIAEAKILDNNGTYFINGSIFPVYLNEDGDTYLVEEYEKGEPCEHIRVAEHRKHSALPQPCLTKEQAAIIRAAHWAGFANSYTRSIEILKGGGQQTFDF